MYSGTITASTAICFLTIIIGVVHGGFLERFCSVNCSRGMGGNLCRCNGFHFAGKRTMTDNFIKDSKDSVFSYPYRDMNAADLDLSSLEEDNLEENHDRSHRIKETKLFLSWLLHRLQKR